MSELKRYIWLFPLLFLLAFACVYVFHEVQKVNTTVSGPTICGTIVDESGAPLDGVKVMLEYREPIPFFQRKGAWPNAPTYKHVHRSMTVNGEFEVSDKELSRMGEIDSLYFTKEGYEIESYGADQKYAIAPDGTKVFQWNGMRVVMRKEPPPPKRVQLFHVSWNPKYYMSFREKGVTVLFGPDSDGADQRPRNESVSLPIGEELKGQKYFEVDFERDDKGEIVTREFPGVVDEKGVPMKYPAVFILRLHSDDPADGIILVDEGKSVLEQNPFDGRIREYGDGVEYREEYTQIGRKLGEAPIRFLEERKMAPEDGYTRREVSFPVEEVLRIWNYGDEGLKTVWCSGYRLAFVRVAGHYAKARFSFPGRSWDLGFPEDAFHPVDEMALNNEDFSFLIDLEMYVNAEAGDRHLSESY